MTIRQQGGVFGRNPTFNDVDVDGTFTSRGIDDNSSSTALTLNASNRVGVGVVPSNWITNGFTGLQVGSGASISGRVLAGTEDQLYLSANAYNDGAWKYLANGFATNYYQDNGTHIWRTAASGSAGGTISFSNTMSLDTSGNVSPTGNVVLANGKGIDFSATSGTGTSELFADYEEGTWTGTYGGNTATGTYTKIGRVVHVDITLVANSASFSSITGLPYSAAGGGYSGGFSFGSVNRMDILDANNVPCRISVSGTTINFTTNVTTGGSAAFTITSDASGTVRAGLSGVYYV